MEKAHIQTPLGIAKITGNENGISSISVSDEGTISIAITCFTSSGYSTQRIL
jgi:methylated-DNA-[protein]-cysteine S-methyltransferase